MKWKFPANICNTKTRTKTSSVSSASCQRSTLSVVLESAIDVSRFVAMMAVYILSRFSIQQPVTADAKRESCSFSDTSMAA